jgi:hypothetical protein
MKHNKRKKHYLPTIALLSSAIVGCVYNHQIISQPYVIEAATEWKITHWTWSTIRHSILYSSYLSVNIYPHNGSNSTGIMLFPIPGIPFPYGESIDRKVFKVSIVFGESGKYWHNAPRGLEFNPSKTQLKLANGQIILPSGFTNPQSHNCILSSRETSRFYVDMDKWIVIPDGNKENCIDLIYSIPPPHPKENFDITIFGLRKERQDIDVPTIHFKEGILNPWPPGS